MKKKITGFVMVAVVIAIGCNNSATTNDQKDTVVVTNEKKEVIVRNVEVTPVIQTKFKEQNPKATDVQWTKYEAASAPVDVDWELAGWPALDTMDYTAKYRVDNTDYWSWYTDEGEWVSTVATINHADLPEKVNMVLRNNFTDYTVTSVNKENDKNRTAYEIKMERGEDKMKLLIDENGNIMKKKGKEDGVKTKEKNKEL